MTYLFVSFATSFFACLMYCIQYVVIMLLVEKCNNFWYHGHIYTVGLRCCYDILIDYYNIRRRDLGNDIILMVLMRKSVHYFRIMKVGGNFWILGYFEQLLTNRPFPKVFKQLLFRILNFFEQYWDHRWNLMILSKSELLESRKMFEI